MKFITIITMMTLMVACGKESSSKQVDTSTIFSEFTSQNPRFPSLDLRMVTMGQEEEAQMVISSETCSGVDTGNPANTSVSKGKVLVQGTEKEGTISFGVLPSPLPRVDGNHCRVVATETYQYKVQNGTLTLKNLKYNSTDVLKAK